MIDYKKLALDWVQEHGRLEAEAFPVAKQSLYRRFGRNWRTGVAREVRDALTVPNWNVPVEYAGVFVGVGMTSEVIEDLMRLTLVSYKAACALYVEMAIFLDGKAAK